VSRRHPANHQPVDIQDEDGNVSVADVEITSGADEEVRWFAHGDHDAVVVFAASSGSPFRSSIFHVPAGGSVSSGLPVVSLTRKKRYKYAVIGEHGSQDPGVIIKP
jgi:hypothetical protein